MLLNLSQFSHTICISCGKVRDTLIKDLSLEKKALYDEYAERCDKMSECFVLCPHCFFERSDVCEECGLPQNIAFAGVLAHVLMKDKGLCACRDMDKIWENKGVCFCGKKMDSCGVCK